MARFSRNEPDLAALRIPRFFGLHWRTGELKVTGEVHSHPGIPLLPLLALQDDLAAQVLQYPAEVRFHSLEIFRETN